MLDTLTEIQERHDTAREIESKLLELRQVIVSIFYNLISIYSSGQESKLVHLLVIICNPGISRYVSVG